MATCVRLLGDSVARKRKKTEEHGGKKDQQKAICRLQDLSGALWKSQEGELKTALIKNVKVLKPWLKRGFQGQYCAVITGTATADTVETVRSSAAAFVADELLDAVCALSEPAENINIGDLLECITRAESNQGWNTVLYYILDNTEAFPAVVAARRPEFYQLYIRGSTTATEIEPLLADVKAALAETLLKNAEEEEEYDSD